MLKLVKLNAEYGPTLKMAKRGVRKVVRIPIAHWERRAALFPYSLGGEFAVVVELARGGNRDFIHCNKAGVIQLGVDYTCDTFVVLWNQPCEYTDNEAFSMYQASHGTLAFLVFPYHFRLDDNPNKLDFKHAFGIPTSEFVEMRHMRIDTHRPPLIRSESNWAWRTEEPILEGWRYYPFRTPIGVSMYRVIGNRNLTSTEVRNHLHGGYPGIVEVKMVKDDGELEVNPEYLYYCASLHQVKRVSRT